MPGGARTFSAAVLVVLAYLAVRGAVGRWPDPASVEHAEAAAAGDLPSSGPVSPGDGGAESDARNPDNEEETMIVYATPGEGPLVLPVIPGWVMEQVLLSLDQQQH